MEYVNEYKCRYDRGGTKITFVQPVTKLVLGWLNTVSVSRARRGGRCPGRRGWSKLCIFKIVMVEGSTLSARTELKWGRTSRVRCGKWWRSSKSDVFSHPIFNARNVCGKCMLERCGYAGRFNTFRLEGKDQISIGSSSVV
jgi:hypothetical protein